MTAEIVWYSIDVQVFSDGRPRSHIRAWQGDREDDARAWARQYLDGWADEHLSSSTWTAGIYRRVAWNAMEREQGVSHQTDLVETVREVAGGSRGWGVGLTEPRIQPVHVARALLLATVSGLFVLVWLAVWLVTEGDGWLRLAVIQGLWVGGFSLVALALQVVRWGQRR